MKKISTLAFLLIGFVGFAQLTVKPSMAVNENDNEDHYIYVKGSVISINGTTELVKNNNTSIASIYLREKGQLLQKNDNSPNAGTGIISVYQEGTSDAYAYNYWGSPVGVLTGNDTGSGNKKFGIGALNSPQTTLESLPPSITNSYEGSADPLAISKRWIYKFVSTGDNDYADWIFVGDNYAINAGEGFTMKGVNGTDATTVNGVQNNPGSNQRYDFRGRPNNGLIELPSAVAEGEVIVVGNPYPSALNLNYFLLENSGSGTINCGGQTTQRRNSTTGIAYFWDSDPSVQSHNIADYVGGYASYSPSGACNSSGVYAPPVFYKYTTSGDIVTGTGDPQPIDQKQNRRFLPIGQGFNINAPSGAIVPVQFKNAHRSFVKEGAANESVFDRPTAAVAQQTATITNNSTVIPKMRVNIEFNDTYTRQIAIAFMDNATTGYDVAMDAANKDALGSDAGSLINGSNYVIDIRPYDEEDRIPLYLNLNQQADLAININNFENFDTENVYLYDSEVDEYYPIKDEYFYITLPAGDYTGRFELSFKNDEEDLAVAEEIAESFTVIQNNTAQQLEIYNPKTVALKSVAIYDMNGKQLLNQQNLGSDDKFSFSTKSLAQAIYVVRIITEDNTASTKKITVFK